MLRGKHNYNIFVSNETCSTQQFEEDALAWEDKLNRINALFDVWIDVQRRWVYLEGIFTGSADIKHLLPVETSRFQGYVYHARLCNKSCILLCRKIFTETLFG